MVAKRVGVQRVLVLALRSSDPTPPISGYDVARFADLKRMYKCEFKIFRKVTFCYGTVALIPVQLQKGKTSNLLIYNHATN